MARSSNKISNRFGRPRRGVTLAGLVAGMTVLIAFVAISVDVSLMNSYETEARAAADAAALAGVAELWDRDLLPAHLQTVGLADADSAGTSIPQRQMQCCQQQARQCAAANTVGGQPLQLAAEDVEFAYAGNEPTLTVHGVLSEQRGHPARRVMGRILGMGDAALHVQSRAILDQRVIGFAPSSLVAAPVVPIVIDATSWSSQVQAASLVTIVVRVESQVQTGTAKLCMMRSAYDDVINDLSMPTTVVLTRQIQSGLTLQDLASLPNQTLALSSSQSDVLDLALADTSSHAFADFRNALQSLAGRPRVWLLGQDITVVHDRPATRIVGFVAAKLVACSVSHDESGTFLSAILSPCLFSTSTAVVSPNQLRNPWLAKTYLVN